MSGMQGLKIIMYVIISAKPPVTGTNMAINTELKQAFGANRRKSKDEAKSFKDKPFVSILHVPF
jgi:hypothetical protein